MYHMSRGSPPVKRVREHKNPSQRGLCFMWSLAFQTVNIMCVPFRLQFRPWFPPRAKFIHVIVFESVCVLWDYNSPIVCTIPFWEIPVQRDRTAAGLRCHLESEDFTFSLESDYCALIVWNFYFLYHSIFFGKGIDIVTHLLNTVIIQGVPAIKDAEIFGEALVSYRVSWYFEQKA